MSGTSFRLGQFAQRYLREPCRCARGIDSLDLDLQYRMMYGVINKHKPAKWTGFGFSAQTTEITSGFYAGGALKGFGVGWSGGGTPSSTVAGEAVVWPLLFGDTGVIAGNEADQTALWYWILDATTLARFNGGSWGQSGLNARVAFYRSATVGLGTVKLIGYRDTDYAGGTVVAAQALTSGAYTTGSVAIPNHATRGAVFTVETSTGIDETGKNLYPLGVRFFTDESGLEVVTFGVGGSTISNHVDPARVSDAALAAFVAMYNINTVWLQVGENDDPVGGGIAFSLNVSAEVQRWKTAITNNGGVPRFLLSTTWQTSNTNAAKVAAIDAILLILSQADTTVSWLSLGGIDNGFAYEGGVGTTYLPDHQHTGTPGTGADYFAALENGYLQSALDGYPSSAGSVVFGGASAIHRSQSRRDIVTGTR